MYLLMALRFIEQILKRTERATHYKSKGQPQPNIMQADE